MTDLSQLTFGAPLLLAALAVLPLLWWLLRVTPPLPKRTLFPPLGLLRNLKDEEQTPAKTPWWLLLLRLIAAALLIFALADPLLGQSPKLKGSGPLVLVVDNGWTAAKDWSARQDAIADLLHAAGGRPVVLLPTASPVPTGLLNAGEAARLTRELRPMPWPGDRHATALALTKLKPASPALYWLSDGLEDGHSGEMMAALRQFGSPTVYA
ncbi:MAG TPA: BatA domain-containing protein, partial [Rhizomicrobium sp.]|nr:BatA domain-containing protein [Rhizomicrobium sp.]